MSNDIMEDGEIPRGCLVGIIFMILLGCFIVCVSGDIYHGYKKMGTAPAQIQPPKEDNPQPKKTQEKTTTTMGYIVDLLNSVSKTTTVGYIADPLNPFNSSYIMMNTPVPSTVDVENTKIISVDGHIWIIFGKTPVHHPDCPCQKKEMSK